MSLLETSRMMIIPCSLQIAKATVLKRNDLKQILSAEIPETWPSDELKGFLPFYIEALEKDPSEFGWGIWILIENRNKVVVGDAGFKGKPDGHGEIEIGYGILSQFQKQGYATEAAKALADWAFTNHHPVNAIKAECDMDNAASIKVLEKLGMERNGLDGSIMKWKLERGRWHERN